MAGKAVRLTFALQRICNVSDSVIKGAQRITIALVTEAQRCNIDNILRGWV